MNPSGENDSSFSDDGTDPDGHMARATLGPLRYEFDAGELLMAEVPVEIPPGSGDHLWGMKLIPTERAELLGQNACRYGSPQRDQMCEATKEPGLTLVLLTRPLDYYRRALITGPSPSPPAGPADVREFSFTEEADGDHIDYRFIEWEDRTVLVGWHIADGPPLGHAAIRDVIRNVDAGLSALRHDSE